MPLPENAVDNAVAALDGMVGDLMSKSGIPGMAVAGVAEAYDQPVGTPGRSVVFVAPLAAEKAQSRLGVVGVARRAGRVARSGLALFRNLIGRNLLGALFADERVTFQAGTHQDAVTMTLADYRKIAQPEVAYFGKHL